MDEPVVVSTSRMTPDELADMMLYIVRSEVVFQRAVGLLDPDLFDPVSEAHYLLLWVALLEVYEQIKEFPTPVKSLRHNIVRRLSDEPELLSSDMTTWLLGASAAAIEDPKGQEEPACFLAWLYAADQELLVDSEGLALLQRFLEERSVIDRLRQIVGSDPTRTPTNFRSVLDSLSQRASQITTLGADPLVEAIPEVWEGMEVGYFTTGVDFLDELLAGGHAPGETIGFMAPYGVGKTLLAVQTGVESAKYLQSIATNGDMKHVFLVTYEEAARTIQHRVLSYAADISLSRIQSLKSYDELSRRGNLLPYERRFFREVKGISDFASQDGEFERLQKARQLINRNFHIVDFSGANNCGYGFVDEIVAVLRRMKKERGWEPGCVLIDFVGRAVERHLAFRNLDAAQHSHWMIRRFADQARTNIAEDFHTPVWLLHQYRGAVVDSSPTRDMSHTDAFGCRSFGESLWFSLTLSNLDEKTQVGRIRCSKARRGGTTDKTVLVKREGQFSRFRDARNSFVVDVMSGAIIPRGVAESLVGGVEESSQPRTTMTKEKAARQVFANYAPFLPPDS